MAWELSTVCGGVIRLPVMLGELEESLETSLCTRSLPISAAFPLEPRFAPVPWAADGSRCFYLLVKAWVRFINPL